MKTTISTFLLLLILLSSNLKSIACADGYMYLASGHYLNQYGFTHKYFPFQFDDFRTYYGAYPYEDYGDNNLNEWSNYLKVPKDNALYEFVYKNSIENLKTNISSNAAIKKAILDKQLQNYFILTYEYLETIKQLQGDWNNESAEQEALTFAKLNTLLPTATAMLDANINSELAWRYLYLALRISFFGKNYSQANDIYNKYASRLNHNNISTVKGWCYGIKAGCLKKLNNPTEAKYYAAKAFDASNDNYTAHSLTYKHIKASIKDVLAFCKNDKEKVMVYLLENINTAYFNINSLNELSQLDANNDAIPLLWLRETAKLKLNYLGDKTISKLELKNHLETLLQFANNYLKGNGKHKSVITNTLLSYAVELKKDDVYITYLNLAKNNASTDWEKLQVELIEQSYLLNNNKPTKNSKDILALLEKIETQKFDNYDNQNARIFTMQKLLSTQLLKEGDTVRAFLINQSCQYFSYNYNEFFWDNLNPYEPKPEYYYNQGTNTNFEFYFTNDEFDYLAEACTEETINKLVSYLSSSSNNDKLDIYLTKNKKMYLNAESAKKLLAERYMRRENWKDALAIYNELPANYNTSAVHPYRVAGKDYIQVYDSSTLKSNTIQILERAQGLKTKIDNNTASTKDYFDYGCLLYNVSANGSNHWMLANHYRYQQYLYTSNNRFKPIEVYTEGSKIKYKIDNNLMDYYTCNKAQLYLSKALPALTDNGDKTKCLFMMAKIWQSKIDINKKWPNKKASFKSFHPYTIASLNNPYFEKIKTLPSNAEKTRLQNECSYLGMYLK
jgi:hypothetical protein